MANELDLILHRIRIRLYPNYLPKTAGAYIARTNNQKTLSIEEVCSIMKTRGGFAGDYGDLVKCVRKYYEEVAYQLCDGYAINNGYYSVYPNVGGTFDSISEAHDKVKHPIGFRFGIRSKLRELIKDIVVEVESLANKSGYIDTFTDLEEDSVNTIFIPGNQFAIHGNKIKIVGKDPSCGLYFISEEDPSKAVKVTRIGENFPAKITGIAPDTGFVNNRIEIRTQFSGSSNTFLKEPRIIKSEFSLEVA